MSASAGVDLSLLRPAKPAVIAHLSVGRILAYDSAVSISVPKRPFLRTTRRPGLVTGFAEESFVLGRVDCKQVGASRAGTMQTVWHTGAQVAEQSLNARVRGGVNRQVFGMQSSLCRSARVRLLGCASEIEYSQSCTSRNAAPKQRCHAVERRCAVHIQGKLHHMWLPTTHKASHLRM